MTQKDAAEKIGINYRHFQDIERGLVDLRLSSLLRIHNKLQFERGSLFSGLSDSLVNHAIEDQDQYHESWNVLFEDFVERDGQPYCVLDRNDNYAFVNSATINVAGVENAQEMIGNPGHQFILEQSLPVFRKNMELLRSNKGRAYKIWVRNNAGDKLELVRIPRPMFDENGEYQGTCTIAVTPQYLEQRKKRLASLETALAVIDQHLQRG